MKKVFTVLWLITFCAFTGMNAKAFAQEPSPYAPSTVKAFADSLYGQGFLTQAEGEYKRYLYSFDFNSQLEASQILEFQSTLNSLCGIYKSQQNKTGVQWLRNNFYGAADNSIKQRMNLLQGKYIFMERNAAAFESFCQPLELTAFTADFSSLIKASGLVLNKNIAELSELCKQTVGEQGEASPFFALGELAASYKLKKPGVALLLSTLIPGSGKWYTGSFGAFTSSFLTIGSFVAGTVVTGIQTNWKSWQPYVFGACGLVLYIADLYGSYQSAKRYNDALYRHLCEETEKIYETLY
ncbi:MAG: hypothetical protein J5726_00095 [Treponema sp.]|nr:hypothetical protein [Treponema sp.]